MVGRRSGALVLLVDLDLERCRDRIDVSDSGALVLLVDLDLERCRDRIDVSDDRFCTEADNELLWLLTLVVS